MVLPSCSICRVANSTPTVPFESAWNSSFVKRCSKPVLPTFESPWSPRAGLASGACFGASGRWLAFEATHHDDDLEHVLRASHPVCLLAAVTARYLSWAACPTTSASCRARRTQSVRVVLVSARR
eukprot:scaffold68814_cov72-Phaeocystis_antarctica.AAC.3